MLLRTQKAFETRDGTRVVLCWPIVGPYLESRSVFRLEPHLNLELPKWMVQVGAIELALTERLVMAPPVVALAPLSGPAASAPP